MLVVSLSLTIADDTYKAQHIYAPGHHGSQEKSGVVGYYNCARQCHLLDKKTALIETSGWESLVGKKVWIEETAGWLVLWGDSSFTKPILPVEDELNQIFHENEKGYLKDALSIRIQ